MSGRGIKLIMEHRENGAPDAQSNEQKVIKIDAASTAASATSGQSDETKAVSDSALPQYGSDMDAGRPAKRPGLLGKLRDSLISGEERDLKLDTHTRTNASAESAGKKQ